jgi:hypothetical protein
MLAPVLFLATYTTFGPIAQDDTSLYIADHGSIVRVDKNDPAKRTTLTIPTTRRIAAIDVDGGRVYYATAPAPDCRPHPLFPPETLYRSFNCGLTDIYDPHELKSVSTSGGEEQVIFTSADGITEIAHDETSIYWLVPSNSARPMSGQLFAKNKTTGTLISLANSLAVSAVFNQHPFVVGDDALYVASGASLLRVPKAGGDVTAVVTVDVDSSISGFDGKVYFTRQDRVFALDTATGSSAEVQVRLAPVSGAPFPTSVIGAAPGLVLPTQETGFQNEALYGWTLSDLCTNTATSLGSISASVFDGYFIPPLTVPPIAVDSTGVFIGDRRVTSFTTLPTGCGRRRGVGH